MKAKAEWHKAWEKVGVVDVDDYVMDCLLPMGLGRLIKFNGPLMLLNIGKSYFYNFGDRFPSRSDAATLAVC